MSSRVLKWSFSSRVYLTTSLLMVHRQFFFFVLFLLGDFFFVDKKRIKEQGRAKRERNETNLFLRGFANQREREGERDIHVTLTW